MSPKYEIINYKIEEFERIHNAKPKNILELYINYTYRYTTHVATSGKESVTSTFLIFEFDDKENLYKLNRLSHSQNLIIFLVNNDVLSNKGRDNYYLNKSILLGLI
jgi:hypothetical protein